LTENFTFKRQWGPRPQYWRVLGYERPNNDFTIISGPCSVESRDQIFRIAKYVSESGATYLRGGVFRAGTFVGKEFGLVSLDLLEDYADATKAYGLKNIIEVLDYEERELKIISEYCSAFQVGARSMQNYRLLRLLGCYEKPVFLKRHPGATLDEFLGAADHLLTGGVKELYLIERGSVSHVNHCRWDLSISMIPAIKQITSIPILVDASHGTGRRDLVEPMTLAGVAAGADGVLIETHYNPEESFSDADQAIDEESYKKLMIKVNKIREALL
jgi:3-deoxy-7-phosphoheptulonate synthase